MIGWLAKLLGVGERAPVRVIYLCAGPNCCRPDVGKAAYDHLARRLAELRGRGRETAGCVRAGCFNVCGDGPVAVVMPERVWYSAMTPDRLDRVVDEHLLRGKIVAEYAFEAPVEARAPGGRPRSGPGD